MWLKDINHAYPKIDISMCSNDASTALNAQYGVGPAQLIVRYGAYKN